MAGIVEFPQVVQDAVEEDGLAFSDVKAGEVFAKVLALRFIGKEIAIIRHADLMALFRRAPDVMSFAQSEVHEATGLLPLVTNETLGRLSDALPAGWRAPLNSLPGSMPSKKELAKWLKELRSNLE